MPQKGIEFYRKTANPGVWAPDSIYFVKKSANEAELYFVDSSGNPFNVGNTTFGTAVINALKGANNGLASLDGTGKIPPGQLPAISTASELIVEADYLAYTSAQGSYGANKIVLVKDASADSGVNSGAALYVWEEVGTTSTRIAEFESLDVSLEINAKVEGAGAADKATLTDGDTIEFKAGTNLAITRNGNVFTFDLTGAAPHSHSNLALLETYTETNANIAAAISNSHFHSNKTLLDAYTYSNAQIGSAVSASHAHSNKTLLDTYTAANVDIVAAINNSHTHSNGAVLDLLSVASGALTYNGDPVVFWSAEEF